VKALFAALILIACQIPAHAGIQPLASECEADLTEPAPPATADVLIDPVGKRFMKLAWVNRIRAERETGYKVAMTFKQRSEILTNLDIEKVSQAALDFIAAFDPSWRLRRQALDLATRKLFARVGYDWVRISSGEEANPLEKYLEGFGKAGSDWRRTAVEVLLQGADGRRLAEKVVFGREGIASWSIDQIEMRVRKPSAGAEKRMAWVSRLYQDFDAALDRYFARHPERESRNHPGTDFKAPALSEVTWRAVLWMRDHDEDGLVRRRASDLINAYMKFGGAAYIQVEVESEVALKPLPMATERFTDSELNPFRLPERILPLKGVAGWELNPAEVGAHFRKTRSFETDTQWLEFIAKLSRLTNLSRPTSDGNSTIGEVVHEFLREVAHFHKSSAVRLGATVAAVELSQ
jgi:hypothetical protein